MKRALIASAAAVIGLTAAAAAIAGPFGRDAGFGPGMGGATPAGFMGGGHARMCADGGAMIAGGIAFAEKRLGITDAQRPAWNKLADAVRAAEPAMKTACDTMQAHRAATTPVPLPERLATMQKMVTLGQEQLNRIQPALADLYAQLTPEQKKIADSVGPGPGGRGGQGMRGHHFGWGGWGNQAPAQPAPQQQ